MPHHLFLSHDSRDRQRATVLATMINRMTLSQISVWHSSDTTGTGGLQPGQVWLDEIRSRLSSSKAIVSLLTPTSVARPWLLFESGFGAANTNCDVIPVCVGIDSFTDVPFPLAMYQAYLLSDYESLKRFAQKLLSRYEINFDEEMARPVLTEAVKQLSQAAEGATPQQLERKDPTLKTAIEELKEHIDKRLVSLISKSESQVQTANASDPLYVVSIDLCLDRMHKSPQFVEIAALTTVQNVLDRIYFMLDGEVDAYKYLEQWILRESSSGEYLVTRGVQDRIPAHYIFGPGKKMGSH